MTTNNQELTFNELSEALEKILYTDASIPIANYTTRESFDNILSFYNDLKQRKESCEVLFTILNDFLLSINESQNNAEALFRLLYLIGAMKPVSSKYVLKQYILKRKFIDIYYKEKSVYLDLINVYLNYLDVNEIDTFNDIFFSETYKIEFTADVVEIFVRYLVKMEEDKFNIMLVKALNILDEDHIVKLIENIFQNEPTTTAISSKFVNFLFFYFAKPDIVKKRSNLFCLFRSCKIFLPAKRVYTFKFIEDALFYSYINSFDRFLYPNEYKYLLDFSEDLIINQYHNNFLTTFLLNIYNENLQFLNKAKEDYYQPFIFPKDLKGEGTLPYTIEADFRSLNNAGFEIDVAEPAEIIIENQNSINLLEKIYQKIITQFNNSF